MDSIKEFVKVSLRLPEHAKIDDLSVILGMKPLEVWPRLVLLWIWAFRNAPDGDITSLFQAGLETGKTGRILELPKEDAEIYLNGLVTVGFADEKDAIFILHDWHDGSGDYLSALEKRRTQGRIRAKRAYDKKTTKEIPEGNHADTEPNANLTRENGVDGTVSNADLTQISSRGTGTGSITGSITMKDGRTVPAIPYAEIAALWNSICVPALPAIQGMKDARKRMVKSRWFEAKERQNLIWWETYFRAIVASDFLAGRETKFRASFDWILKPSSMTKILEGNYTNRAAPGQADLYQNLPVIPDEPVRQSGESDDAFDARMVDFKKECEVFDAKYPGERERYEKQWKKEFADA